MTIAGQERLTVPGPAGALQTIADEAQGLQQPYYALVCHPHPLGGGTMHNKVVYHAMKVFSWLGLPVLRFNFRGVGLSAVKRNPGVKIRAHPHR